jgi:hypothetical protein
MSARVGAGQGGRRGVDRSTWDAVMSWSYPESWVGLGFCIRRTAEHGNGRKRSTGSGVFGGDEVNLQQRGK